MKSILLNLALLLAVVAPLSAPRAQDLSDEGNAAENQAARPVALAFLKVIDGGGYSDSWSYLGDNMRATLTRDEWVDLLGKARQAVGPLESRELVGVRHATSVQDGPPGNYYLVFYHSRYGGKDWQEKVVFSLKGKAYRVEGYFIAPSDATGTVTR